MKLPADPPCPECPFRQPSLKYHFTDEQLWKLKPNRRCHLSLEPGKTVCLGAIYFHVTGKRFLEVKE